MVFQLLKPYSLEDPLKIIRMALEPSKRCKSVQTPLSRDLRLKMEVSELLADVNDFLWQYYGRPQYVIRKLQFAPWTILKEDLEQLKAMLERAPNPEQLSKCRQLVMAQATSENKGKLEQLERGIEVVKKVKEPLVELVARVQNQLSSTGNISPALTSVKAISAVKFATLGNGNGSNGNGSGNGGNTSSLPKCSIWQVRESKVNLVCGSSANMAVKSPANKVTALPSVIAKSVRKLPHTAKRRTFAKATDQIIGAKANAEEGKTATAKAKVKSPADKAK